MGQRHQIYVKMPSTRQGKSLGIAGFHHQWLYGMTAIDSLARVVNFYLKQDKEYGPLSADVGYGLKRQSEVIRSLYSVCPESGYWHYVHNLREDEQDYAEREDGNEDPPEIVDPRNGDNNDGITIIDLSNGDFRYCFMSVSHLEGEKNPKTLVPMSAREYLLCYYPFFFEKKGRKDWRDEDKSKRFDIDQKTFDSTLHSLLLIEENSKQLSLLEVKKMFPAMFKKAPKQKRGA